MDAEDNETERLGCKHLFPTESHVRGQDHASWGHWRGPRSRWDPQNPTAQQGRGGVQVVSPCSQAGDTQLGRGSAAAPGRLVPSWSRGLSLLRGSEVGKRCRGGFVSAGGRSPPYPITGRSSTTCTTGAARFPFLGDHPPRGGSSRFLIVGALKQEAD